MSEKLIIQHHVSFSPSSWTSSSVKRTPSVNVGLRDMDDDYVCLFLSLAAMYSSTATYDKTVAAGDIKVSLTGELVMPDETLQISTSVSTITVSLSAGSSTAQVRTSQLNYRRLDVPQTATITLATTNSGGATLPSSPFTLVIPPKKQNATKNGARITYTSSRTGVKYDLLNYT